MRRPLILGYGILCYVIFLATFLYAVGFLGNFAVPYSIDSEVRDPLGGALLIDLLLLSVFAVQHSLMARPTFKKWWTQFIPEPAERSTYVLFSSLALILLFCQWRPIEGIVWNVEPQALRVLMYVLFGVGWLTVLVATFQINHFDLFGLRQAWLYWGGKPYTDLPFTIPFLYKFVRHPLYVGWLIVFWATPTMSVAHLVFALGTTIYIFVAIPLEERNLLQFLGEDYAEYRRSTPLIVPRLFSRGKQTTDDNVA